MYKRKRFGKKWYGEDLNGDWVERRFVIHKKKKMYYLDYGRPSSTGRKLDGSIRF